MPFVPGKVVKEFEADGKKVRLRYPKWEDLEHLHKYINRMIKERTFIGRQKTISMKEETEWLSVAFKKLHEGKEILIVAEVEGRVAGSAEVKRKELDANRHMGTFGIGLLKEYREMGIGTQLTETLLGLARKKMGIKIVQSSYFSMNKASERLHKKMGFKEVGRIPKGCSHYGRYYDDVIMYKEV